MNNCDNCKKAEKWHDAFFNEFVWCDSYNCQIYLCKECSKKIMFEFDEDKYCPYHAESQREILEGRKEEQRKAMEALKNYKKEA